MSDELASNTATLEQPSQDGQAERASGERPQGHTDGQPSENKGQAVQEQDNIRKLQSTYDKKIAEERKTFQAQMQQQQQVIQQLQREMREARKSAATDDYQRLEMELQWAQQERDQYAQAYSQHLQQQQAETAKRDAFQRIADRYGVAVKDIEAAEPTDYESAVDAAIEARDKKRQKKQQDDEQRAADNMPDVGVGAPRTTKSQWERDWQAAKEARNSTRMMELKRTMPADMKGGR